MKHQIDTKKTIICLVKIGDEPILNNVLKSSQVTEFNVAKHLANANANVQPGYHWTILKTSKQPNK